MCALYFKIAKYIAIESSGGILRLIKKDRTKQTKKASICSK